MTPNEDFIARNEYEARHTEMRAEVARIMTRIDLLSDKMDRVNERLASSRTAGWKLLAISLINFLVGGVLTSVTIYILHIPK